jgi:capsule polysaccharide export protein KpsE/RkpR
MMRETDTMQDQNSPVQRTPTTSALQTSAAGERTLLEGLLYYLGILWRYKALILVISVVGAVGIVAFSVVSLVLPPERSPLPNRYQATASLLLQRGANENMSAGVLASLGIDMPGSSGGFDYGVIALEVLQNRSFIDTIVAQNDVVGRYEIEEKIRTKSREVVLNNATFDFDARSGILMIGYEHVDPEYAAQVTQSMVDELLAWFAARGGSDRLVAVETMEEKLAEVEDQIALIEGQIEEFQRTYGVLQVEEIAQTQSDLLGQFQSQLLQLDLQISNVRGTSNIENDPELLALQAQRQNILELMDRIERGYAGTNELLPPRDELPGLAAEYTRFQMNLEIQGRIYEALTEQYEVAKLTADTDPAFTILEPVEVPEEKASPSRGQLCVMVTAGSFFGAIVIALLLNSIHNIARDPQKRRLLREEQA